MKALTTPESTNPFSFGKVASQERFCNRTRELSELTQFMRSHQNIWLFSPRRFGKTSLIQKALRQVTQIDPSVRTVYFDVFDTTNEEEFSISFAQALASAFVTKIDKSLELVKTVFSSLAPRIILSDDGKPEVQFGIRSNTQNVKVFDEVMKNMEALLLKTNASLCIAIDEFQQIQQYKNAFSFQAKLRKYIQFQKNVSYTFLGSQRHLMQDLFTSKKKPFYQSAIAFPIKPIESQELVKLMMSLTHDTLHPFTSQLAYEIAKLTEGHPYNTEKLAFYVYNALEKKAEVSTINLAEFVRQVLLEVSDREDSIYKNYLTLLTSGQREVLIAIAKFSGKIPSNEMVREFGLSSRQFLDTAILSLLKKDLIDEADDGIKIYDLFLKTWLERRRISG